MRTRRSKGEKVGIVFDIGGKNDKSFNEAAWRGLQRAEAELGILGTFIEPAEGSDRESALRIRSTWSRRSMRWASRSPPARSRCRSNDPGIRIQQRGECRRRGRAAPARW